MNSHPGLWILFIWGLLCLAPGFLAFFAGLAVLGGRFIFMFTVFVACLWILPLSPVMHAADTSEFHAKPLKHWTHRGDSGPRGTAAGAAVPSNGTPLPGRLRTEALTPIPVSTKAHGVLTRPRGLPQASHQPAHSRFLMPNNQTTHGTFRVFLVFLL